MQEEEEEDEIKKKIQQQKKNAAIHRSRRPTLMSPAGIFTEFFFPYRVFLRLFKVPLAFPRACYRVFTEFYSL